MEVMKDTKLLFAGDFCIRWRGIDYMYEEKIAELAAPVKEITEKHDISVVNVETVFTDNPTPPKKSGPSLNSPVVALDLLEKYGFTIGAFANNHSMDQGAEQGHNSYNAVLERGMLGMGFGKNLEEAYKPCRLTKNGLKISIFNFAEHEFVAATSNSTGFAPIDFIENARLIREEKKLADYVFVYLHAGSEQCPFPREGLKQYCRALVDEGADGVIISHPHCPGGMEYYNTKPIVYSLGNFFMAKRNDVLSLWNIGYMASVTIAENGKISVEAIPYEFGNDGSYFRILEGDEKAKVLAYIDTLSKIFPDDNKEEYDKLRCAWSVLFVREAKRDYLDLFMTEEKYHLDLLLFIRNAFSCESHTEVFRIYYTLLTEGKLDDFEDYVAKIKSLQERPL